MKVAVGRTLPKISIAMAVGFIVEPHNIFGSEGEGVFVDEVKEAIREKHGDSVMFTPRKPYGFSVWLKMDSTAPGSSRIVRLVQRSESARPRLLLAASANGGEPRVDRTFHSDVRECLRLFEKELEKVEVRFCRRALKVTNGGGMRATVAQSALSADVY